MKNDADGHSLEWESPAAQALQRVLLSDNNKYVHAFAHEAVRRLSTSVPTPVKASLYHSGRSLSLPLLSLPFILQSSYQETYSPEQDGIWTPVWSMFERHGGRWHPPHYQVECGYVSEPSEVFFAGGGR